MNSLTYFMKPVSVGSLNFLDVMAWSSFSIASFLMKLRHNLMTRRECYSSSRVPSKRDFIPVLVLMDDKNRFS